MSVARATRPLIAVWLFSVFTLAYHAWPAVSGPLTALFLLLASLFQASLFTLPTLGLTSLALRLRARPGIYRSLTLAVYLISFLTVGFLLSNFKLYEMYGFYSNFFVLNIILTPGGIEAMGISSSTWVSLGIATVGLALAYALALRVIRLERLVPGSFRKRWILALVSACCVAQSVVYAYADYQSDLEVLGVADRIVWFVPVTAKSLFESMGIERREAIAADMSKGNGRLSYEFDDLLARQDTDGMEPMNIVWLVAESWRADTVTPEIMPATYEFAQQNQWFANHYSGGNGTRMGMFTQFYGIYGNYWFDMLRAGQAPLLMQYLKALNYDEKAFTSSAFTYPEFDRTIFSNFDRDKLQEFNEGEGWQRDQKNTTDLISFIAEAEDPFFAFMFFESAHANYYFPEEDIIRPDYLEDFNYLTVDVEEEIDQIKSRYVNSAHHLDRQLARVYEVLEAKGLLDNTLVVVTGDHGEEFMENGRWGHNSTFSQQQIRVPLVLHIPGKAAKEYTAMTSHLDVPATILKQLDFRGEDGFYSHGQDLLAENYSRDFTVISDWHGNTLVTEKGKMIFSLKGASMHASVTDINDKPLQENSYESIFGGSLAAYTRDLNKFYN